MISGIAPCRIVEIRTEPDGTHTVHLVTADPPYLQVDFVLAADTMIKLEIEASVTPAVDTDIFEFVKRTEPPRVSKYVADLRLWGRMVPQNKITHTWKFVDSPYGEGFDQCGNRIEES